MTAQTPDLLRIDGRSYALYSNPLAPYLAAHPGRLPKRPASTDLWRGYVAAWTVRDGRLLLHDVKVPAEESGYESVMRQLFDDERRQVATWFSGHLIVPTGDLIDYVHMGYGSTYASYLIVTIVAGEVRERRELDAAAFELFRRAQYERFQRTPEYAEARARLAWDDEPDELLDRFLFHYTAETYLSRL